MERSTGFLFVAVGALAALVGVASLVLGNGRYATAAVFVTAGFALAVWGLRVLRPRE
jgi:hypothetical protein